MKKVLFLLFVALIVNCQLSIVNAQNIQLHYNTSHALYDDLKGRPKMFTTFELYKADKWGHTFMFTDINYYGDGAAGVYWEISREFDISKNKQWAFHLEYNGGATSIKDTSIASRFQHAFLTGFAWNWASSDFNRTFSLQALYKQYFNGMGRDGYAGFQGTAVWGLNFAQGLLTFSGFCDLWYDPDVKGKLILLSQPQFWVNLNALRGMDGVNLSLGTEVEVSNNFVFNDKGANDKFYVTPTLAAKWTF